VGGSSACVCSIVVSRVLILCVFAELVRARAHVGLVGLGSGRRALSRESREREGEKVGLQQLA